MNESFEDLKKEVNSTKSISSQDRDEILSDLKSLEEDNNKQAKLALEEIELKYKTEKKTIIAVCLFVAAIILYLFYGFLVTNL